MEALMEYHLKVITIGKVVAKTVTNTNLINDPGTPNNVIATIPAGTEVLILDESGDWYRISDYNNHTGYVLRSGVSTETPPSNPPDPTKYIVQAGDTLWKIAQKYGTTIDAFVKANNLDPNKQLTIGQKLSIPSSTQPPQNNIVHTVVAGDTLWKIAQKYGTTIDAIVKANNLNPNGFLTVGQKLVIPKA